MYQSKTPHLEHDAHTMSRRNSREGSYLRLWSAVLLVALQDGKSSNPDTKSRALRWINSTDTKPCSFSWVCSLLDFDADYVRRNYNKEAGK